MKREATVIKNTFYMFLRMFFVMALTLLTTRLLLQVLGLENYGIYDLLFGVVLLFNVLSGSMATTLQRFYNVTIADLNGQSNIYSVSLYVFGIIGIFVLILGWFLSPLIVSKLNIPLYSILESTFFLKLCFLNLFFMIFRVPFIALIISNEKMGIYSLISIFDSVLKFLGVLVLSVFISKSSNLEVYGLILCLTSFIISLVYILICYSKLNMPSFKFRVENRYYKEILSFSGWTLFGSSSAIFSQQGLSITLNSFFGVLINAANAVAQQIYTAVYQFVSSFQTAYSPYLMKTYAEKNFSKVSDLIVFFSKFSIFLYLLVALPLFALAEQILQLWLGDVPAYAVAFVRLTLVVVFFEVLSAPLWLTVQASGVIQRYQVVISLILILNLPIAYMCIKVWDLPILAFWAKILTAILAYLYRIYTVRSLACLDFMKYSMELLLRLILLTLILFPMLYFYIYKDLFNIFAIVFIFLIGSYVLLISRSEKKIIVNFVFKFLRKA